MYFNWDFVVQCMRIIGIVFMNKLICALVERLLNVLLELRSLADQGKVSPHAKVLFPCGQLSLETVPKRLAQAGYDCD